jgi:hypothetical protein
VTSYETKQFKAKATCMRERWKQMCEVTEDRAMGILLSKQHTDQPSHTCSLILICSVIFMLCWYCVVVVVNRGGVVNQDDLYEALKSGEIRVSGGPRLNSFFDIAKNRIVIPESHECEFWISCWLVERSADSERNHHSRWSHAKPKMLSQSDFGREDT